LSDSQKQYAALDAYVALQIWDVLKDLEQVGQPLSAASRIGQPVSLYVRKQEVAHGSIIEQPAKYTFLVGSDNTLTTFGVSTTHTRALIRVDKVLAPSCMVSFHKKTLEELQNGQESFTILVSICALRTRGDKDPVTQLFTKETRNIGNITTIKPADTGIMEIAAADGGIALADDSDSSIDSDSESIQQLENEEQPSAILYCQQPEMSHSIPSRILADVFHIIDQLCRTISRRHTAYKRFATAFSETMLIPDQDDKAAMEAVLKKRNMTWSFVKSKSPGWLWKRVRRFIPNKDVLYSVLKELFESWAPVVCKATGQKLFTLESHKKAQSILLEVKKGWVSDPIGISVYQLEGVDKYGLNLYHCIRGTNSVEGSVHNPIRRNFASMNASPELADAMLADFRHRHNVDCGSIHKDHVKYAGHYDPWLDHEICKLREDIGWSGRHTHQHTVIDTDPLDFESTSEQFGITAIPPETKVHCNFQGPEIVPLQEMPAVYPTALHLSKLSGGRKSVYTFLAKAQNTRYAVLPIHTQTESDMFFKEMGPGGAWFVKGKQPDFARMAYWWSEKANGKDIFYKLPEHLALHFSVYKNCLSQTETMVASQNSDSQIKSVLNQKPMLQRFYHHHCIVNLELQPFLKSLIYK
jgi:hypothetical protein